MVSFNSKENKNILFQRTYSEAHKVGNLLPSRKCLRILIPSWKKDHTLAFSMRCMTDHHLKLCRQGCKFCISSLASNGERKKIPFPPFLKCLWCSPHPGEFLVPAQPLDRKTRPKRDRMLHVPSPLNEQWGGRTSTMYYYTFFLYKGYQPRRRRIGNDHNV